MEDLDYAAQDRRLCVGLLEIVWSYKTDKLFTWRNTISKFV